MDKKFDFTEKLDFNDIDLTAPDVVMQDIILGISQATRDIVEGKLAPYSGPIFSYTETVHEGFSVLSSAFQPTSREKRVDIQEKLGKLGGENHKYEFYLGTPSYQKYKYRVCFFQFGTGNYPVEVVLDQHIADSMYARSGGKYIFSCNNPEEFCELIYKAVNSKYAISVMQELIRINQVQRQKEELETEDVEQVKSEEDIE